MKGQVVVTLVLALLGVSEAKIWTLAIGHDWIGHQYFDNEGNYKGFVFDLVAKVCSEGNMDCRLIFDQYKNCWQSNPDEHPSAGKGLIAGWYDGCAGWVPTVERIHTMSFSNPYLEENVSTFFFLSGSNFDPSNLANKKIGFLTGWASNEKCVARQTSIKNNVLTADQIKFVDLPEDIIKALENREIEAVFSSESSWTPDLRSKLDKVDNSYRCFLGGNAIMTRKDSSLIQNWNMAFAKLRDSNQYPKYCDEWNKKHIHKGGVKCKI